MLKSKLLKLSSTTGAAFAMGMFSASGAFAAADATKGGFNDVAGKITEGIAGLPGMLTALSYLMGLLFSVLGILKIKDHVENPTQTQLKDGAIRLVVGGCLFALPVISSSMQELVNTGDAAIEAQKLNKVKFEVK